ncbi:MAG TPA: double-CXXCG motif protein [Blastocatellia bacterium]|nr:double-CXXCG motif protein [Blastocatellia bacterium]
MSLSEVVPSTREITSCGFIDASHEWSLPGVTCVACGNTWGAIGTAYPRLNLQGTKFESIFRDSYPVSLARLEELRQSIRHIVPKGLPLPPGTHFGPLIGTAEGPFCDFVWHDYWDILVNKEALNRLKTEGVQLSQEVMPKFNLLKKWNANLLELQIEPRARMIHTSATSDTCTACGRWGISRPDKIVIDSSTLPEDVDLFRVVSFSTIILANNRFTDAVRRLELTGVSFKPVMIV